MRYFFQAILVTLIFPAFSQKDSLIYYLKSDLNDSLKKVFISNYAYSFFKKGDKNTAEAKLRNAASFYKNTNPVLNAEYNSILARFFFDSGQFDKSIAAERSNIRVVLANKLEKQAGVAFFNLGVGYMSKGDIKPSIGALDSAIIYLKNTSLYRYHAKAIVARGLAEFYQGNFVIAADYLWKALKIQEEHNIVKDVADTYNNLSIIFGELGDYENTLKYQRKSLEYARQTNSKSGIANILGNIGTVYYKMGNSDSAMHYQLLCLPYAEALSNKTIYVNTLASIGELYAKKKDKAKFFEYVDKAEQLSKELKLDYQYCQVGAHKAAFYYEQGDLEKALDYAKKALRIAETNNYPSEIIAASKVLYQIERKRKNYEQALLYQDQYLKANDEMTSEETAKEVMRKTFDYEYNKKAMADSIVVAEERKIKEAEINAANAQLKTEKTIKYALYGGILLILVFAGLIYQKFKASQEQKKIISRQKELVEASRHTIEKQKEIVEEKQKEIIDSINYAKRIQNTLLAKQELIKQFIPENFILFKPKDIVSGDFYWAAHVKKNDLFFLAVCDSTGHGVPGAFMSLLNIGFLSEAINEKGIYQPHLVFDYVRNKLSGSFASEAQRDGFDGVLICLDRQTKIITYAAANNAPVLVENSGILELPCDKMPVGKGVNDNPFTLFSLPFIAGSMIYITSDGFADQFGGEKGKKFKKRKLHDLLKEISAESIETQAQQLEKQFTDWKGELEQVDDVLLAGMRIT